MKQLLLFLFLASNLFANAQWDKTVFDKANPDKYIRSASYSFSGETIWAKSDLDSDTNIYYSKDGGYSFTGVKISNLILDYFYCSFILVVSDSHLYIQVANSNYEPTLFNSLDGGKTWNKFQNSNRDSSNEIPVEIIVYDSIHFSAWYNNYWGQGEICQEIWNTSDAGKTWEKLTCDSIGIPRNLSNVNFKYKKSNCNIIGVENHNKNGNNRVIISENFGHKWYFRETNIPVNVGFLDDFMLRDSLVGFARYSLNDGAVGGGMISTKDGGGTWDTTLKIPDYSGYIYLKYSPPANIGDTGFWIGCSPYENTNYGCFISYDDLKTTIRLDDEQHYDLAVFNTKNIISFVNSKENLFIYTGKENNVGINKIIPKNFNVYPNPFQDEIHIKTFQNSELNIYNLEGKCLLTQNVNSGENILKLTDFVSGIYFLEIKSDNKTERIKLVKTN